MYILYKKTSFNQPPSERGVDPKTILIFFVLKKIFLTKKKQLIKLRLNKLIIFQKKTM